MQGNQAFLNGNRDHEGALVVVFLRGGADGLTLVAPVHDDDYHRARPQLGVNPGDAAMLDGMFGFHPQMTALQDPFESGQMLVVHGAGSEDQTRSHFEAQDFMEHGGNQAGGWLGRYLRFRPGGMPGPLAAVAIGKTLPEVLRGAPGAVVVESLQDFQLEGQGAVFARELSELYALEQGMLGTAGSDALRALNKLSAMTEKDYTPERDADYPSTRFGRSLLQVAQLIKGRVGLEAACIDLDGWDSHFAQVNLINPLMRELAQGLQAFYRDLGPSMATTSVVVMTEFGRRVYENASFGTDHGRGGAMFVMGGGVQGGRVLSDWRGLSDEAREGPGDLPVVHNYRDILAPVLRRHCPTVDLAPVFPGHALTALELYPTAERVA